MKKQFVFFTTILSIFWLACEKELDITLSESSKKIVVEGVIETGQQPYVTLTNSIGFFDKIDLSKVGYIKNAKITVEDINTGKSILLKEYNIDTTIGTQVFSFTLYGPDILDPVAMSFKGEVNHTYKLVIENNGKTHTAYTQIPNSSGLDSIWTEPVPGREDSFSVLKVMYNDPDTLGNSARYATLRNSMVKEGPEVFLYSFQTVFNDDVINGIKFPVTLSLGYDKSNPNIDFQTVGLVKKGDTVTLRWSPIDKQVYNFWESLARSEGSVGNPFVAPTQVIGNVSDAIGIWGGYNTQFYKITDTIK